MPAYRIYELDRDGHVERPPRVIVHSDDPAALEHARTLLGTHDLELWQEARLVARIERKGQ